jgi:hypothetical protein
MSSGDACTDMAVKAACFILEFLWKFLNEESFLPFNLIFFFSSSSFKVYLNHLCSKAS